MTSPDHDGQRILGFPLSVRTLLLAAAFGLSMACSGGGGCGGCGCDGFKQHTYPEKHYDKTVKQTGQVRLTKDGITFLEKQIPNLITQIRPQGLDFCIPKSSSGDATFCYKKQCNNGTKTGCQLNLKLNDASITPKSPDTLLVEMKIGDFVEKIPFKYDLPLGITVTCHLDLHKKNASDSTPAEVGMGLPLRFEIDKQSDLNNTTLKLDKVNSDFSDLAIDIDGGGDCELVDGVVSTFFESQLRNRLKNEITGTVKQQIAQQFCEQCGSSNQSCPSNASCGTKADVDVCKWDANDKCVSSPLGNEGRLMLKSAIGEMVEPSEAKADTLIRATDLAEVDTGVSLGLRTGFQQVNTHRCAPVDPSTRPSFDSVQPSTKILTDKQPNNGESFMVGVGIHERAIEHALWASWASGGTCLRIGADFNEALNTKALKIFISSLENLTERAQPIYLRVSPQTAPEVELGANKIEKDGDDYNLKKPLMKVRWDDLDLHFYAFIQDRYTRLYTTRLDLEIPIGLQPNGMGQIVPVTGDLENASRNVRVRNHQLLAEEKKELKKVVPMLLDQALPSLTGSLAEPIDLPTFSGYKLVVEKDDITSVDNNKFVAIYADLKYVGNMQPLVAQLEPRITDVRVDAPPPTDDEMPEPTVTVDVRAQRSHGFTAENSSDVEYSYRVDNGLWSMFQRSDTLEIERPGLALQGEHRIQIRARETGVPGTASEPVERTVRIDYQAPELDLHRDDRRVVFEGRDVVDSPDHLVFRYRAESESGETLREWTEWSDTNKVDLTRLGTEHPVELTVEARDRAGFVASTTETFPTTPAILVDETVDESPSEKQSSSAACSTGSSSPPPIGGLLLLALGGLGLALRRRDPGGRRRARTVGGLAVLGVAGLLLAGCTDLVSGDANCDPSCKSWQTCKDGKCVGESCSADDDCSCDNNQPGICLDGRCSCKDFCADGCGEDSYCCYAEDSCKSYPNPCDGTSCDPGYKTEVASRGTPDHKACEVADAKCKCVEKEPLPHGWYGVQTSIDSGGGTTAVSTYNRTYGDLMVTTLDDNHSPDWYYPDGLPSDGDVVAGPSGPRGGVKLEGPEVGRHSAIAVDDTGRMHVFYRHNYDETLKYARGTKSSGTYDFSTTTLRDEEGTGLYTSAAVEDGVVHAVYLKEDAEVTVDGIQTTGSRLMHISFPVDTSLGMLAPSPETLDSVGTRNPCGACGEGKRCFLDSTSCKKVTTDCPESCPSGNLCRNGNCESIYLPAGSDATDHRIATGLYSEIIPRSNDLAVLFYDHVNRRVGWVTGSTGNWSDPSFLGSPTGPYSAGAVDSNDKLHLAYMDPTTKSLRYLPPDQKKPETIVDGVRDSSAEHLWAAIGEDVDLWLDSNGGVHATYQDATRHRLYRADRKGKKSWNLAPISKPNSDGSYSGARGFYSANAEPEDGVAVEMVINQQVDPVKARLEFKTLK